MTTTVYLNDIQMNFSVIDVLTGLGNIYIENPWFKPPPGLTSIDEKTFFKKKPTPAKAGGAEQKGTYYTAPKIHVRKNTNDNYTNYTNFILLPSKESKSTIFRISKPYELTAEKAKSINHVLGVQFQDNDLTEKIMRIDQRLTMVVDVMLSAKLLEINIAPLEKCKTNAQFFAEFNQMIAEAIKKYNTVNPKKKFTRTIAYDDDYINCWNVFPIWWVKPPNLQYSFVKEVFEKNADEIDEICETLKLKGVFSQLLTKMTMDGFTTTSAYLKPMNFVRISKKKDTDEIKIYNSTQLRFRVKAPNSKIPENLISQKLIKKSGKLINEPYTTATLSELWGGATSKSATYEGFLITSISLDLSVYGLGSSYIKWDVKQCKMKLSSTGGAQLNQEDIPDISDDSDDDNDDELPPATAKKPLKKGAAEGSIDLGNENEDDDDDV